MGKEIERIERGRMFVKGKTKRGYGVKGQKNLAIFKSTDFTTADNDPDLTRKIKNKGEHCNTINDVVFRLLQQASVPVAFERRLSLTEFLALKCSMIPLEVVIRRNLVGSSFKRDPGTPKGTRLHRLLPEFFLKTTDGQLQASNGEILIKGLTSEQDDPFIVNPHSGLWHLRHPKQPAWIAKSALGSINPLLIMPDNDDANLDVKTRVKIMEDIAKRVFLVIEGAWNTQGLRLIDLKIEFGITNDGKLVVADVIDCDSWRLWRPTEDGGWEDVSKQSFRDIINKDNPDELARIRAKYAFVANLAQQFIFPKPALILWRGSEEDNIPEIPDHDILRNAIHTETIRLSGHKLTERVLQTLRDLDDRYPAGGVIVCFVGRSNGLGPILAAHTHWLVISVPITYQDFPDDVHSSLRMPSNTPNTVVWPAENAVLAALNVLSQTNPIVYMLRRLAIEKLDD